MTRPRGVHFMVLSRCNELLHGIARARDSQLKCNTRIVCALAYRFAIVRKQRNRRRESLKELRQLCPRHVIRVKPNEKRVTDRGRKLPCHQTIHCSIETAVESILYAKKMAWNLPLWPWTFLNQDERPPAMGLVTSHEVNGHLSHAI